MILLLRQQCRTDGHEIIGIGREYYLVLCQIQGFDEALPQLRQELQRTTQEGHVPLDGMTAGQSADHLVHHRLEDGSRNI